MLENPTDDSGLDHNEAVEPVHESVPAIASSEEELKELRNALKEVLEGK